MTDNAKEIMKRHRKFKKVFDGADGQYVLGEIYAFCGLMNQTYANSSSEATAFNEGRRNAALHIYKILNQDLAAVDRTLDEYKSTNQISTLRSMARGAQK